MARGSLVSQYTVNFSTIILCKLYNNDNKYLGKSTCWLKELNILLLEAFENSKSIIFGLCVLTGSIKGKTHFII